VRRQSQAGILVFGLKFGQMVWQTFSSELTRITRIFLFFLRENPRNPWQKNWLFEFMSELQKNSLAGCH
jgi:hypothetical protein